MRINNYIKGKMLYFVISLFALVVLSISSSYAFLNRNKVDVINNNNLVVNYKEVTTNGFNKSNVITIYNSGEEKTRFSLYAKSVEKNNSLELNKIYYSINNGVESLLSNASNGLIYSGYLGSNESIELNIDLWINYELLENSDQGKSILIDFNVQ